MKADIFFFNFTYKHNEEINLQKLNTQGNKGKRMRKKVMYLTILSKWMAEQVQKKWEVVKEQELFKQQKESWKDPTQRLKICNIDIWVNITLW